MKSKLVLLLLLFAAFAHAETSEVRIARQFGITFLPLMVMEQQKLVEKHAKAAGLGDVTVKHFTAGTPAAINDVILSGAAHFVAVGPPSFAALWARSRGTPSEPLAVANVSYINMTMVSRDPRIKTIRDLSDKTRIAMTSPKVSLPAIILQIAAAKEYGNENYTRFDALGVGMPHPDAMTALLSGAQPEICCHFASPPYQTIELQQPGMHAVTSINEVMGGPTSGTLLFTTLKFRTDNPKVFGAVFAGLREAIEFINTNKRAAADIYLQLSKEKSKPEDIVAQLNDPALRYDLTPLNVMKYFDFMHSVGSIKVKPASWKEIFAPEAHGLAGS